MEVNLASAWPLLRAALDLLILGASNPDPANHHQLQLLLALLKNPKIETSAHFQLSSQSAESSPPVTKANRTETTICSTKTKEKENSFQKSVLNVEEEFKKVGLKMPKGIIIKEEIKEDVITSENAIQANVQKQTSEYYQPDKGFLDTIKPKENPNSSRLRKKYKKRAQKTDLFYPCKLCDFQTNLQSKLNKHKLYKHVGRTVMCDQCDKKYFTSAHLREHINSAHSTTGPVICSACPYTTLCERNLKTHFNLQHAEKHILCTECSFTTTQDYRLKEHAKKDHTDEEDWPKCPEVDCSYKNWDANAVKNHFIKVHEGIKFKCEICPNEFSEKANMQAHMLKIHKDLLLKIDNSRTHAPFHERYTFKI